jgi:uncharacterized protein (TIRG00374 family)
MAAIKLDWVVGAAVFLFVSMYLRALRWFQITGLPTSKLAEVWDASCVGYFGTAVYPARAGDILRVLRLTETTGLEPGHTIGSAAVDRILDGLALLVMLMITVLLWGGDLQMWQTLWGIALFFLAIAVGGIVFVLSGHRLRGVFEWAAAKWRWGLRVNSWFNQCLTGSQILRSPTLIMSILSLQIVISLVDIAAFLMLFSAFGWDLPFIAGLISLVYLAAAISLPSSPGYIGVYQITSLMALSPFGVSESAAVAYGTVLQGLTLSSFVVVGILAYRRTPTVQIGGSSATGLDPAERTNLKGSDNSGQAT